MCVVCVRGREEEEVEVEEEEEEESHFTVVQLEWIGRWRAPIYSNR
jgi:hypothetical protein